MVYENELEKNWYQKLCEIENEVIIDTRINKYITPNMSVDKFTEAKIEMRIAKAKAELMQQVMVIANAVIENELDKADAMQKNAIETIGIVSAQRKALTEAWGLIYSSVLNLDPAVYNDKGTRETIKADLESALKLLNETFNITEDEVADFE